MKETYALRFIENYDGERKLTTEEINTSSLILEIDHENAELNILKDRIGIKYFKNYKIKEN